MRIIVETERELIRTVEHNYPAISVRVKVDGQEEIGLTQALNESEMESHFDILWGYIGKKLKDAHQKILEEVNA